MTQESKGPQLKREHVPAPQARDRNRPKEKYEAAEVAGRHRITGQKDHAGAR